MKSLLLSLSFAALLGACATAPESDLPAGWSIFSYAGNNSGNDSGNKQQ